MTTSHRRRSGRLLLTITTLVAVLTAGTLPAAASARQPRSQPTLSVLTRNLYLGADLTPLLTATDLPAAVLSILGQVQASQPAKRMQQVAREIAAADPDVVALQEAATWTSTVPGLTYSYDFTALLLADLAARHEHYRVAVDQANFDSLTGLSVGAALPGRFVDHDVLLVRRGVQLGRTGAAHFATQLTYGSTPVGPVTFTRGYAWADVATRGVWTRVVDTHLEAYSAATAGSQAGELVSALRRVHLPIVLAGDMNSDPANSTAAAADTFAAARYRDAWTAVHPYRPGYTCCQAATLTGPADGSALDQRIDHVYGHGALAPVAAFRVGVRASSATAPMWPSDHAGVVAVFRLAACRPGPHPHAG